MTLTKPDSTHDDLRKKGPHDVVLSPVVCGEESR